VVCKLELPLIASDFFLYIFIPGVKRTCENYDIANSEPDSPACYLKKKFLRIYFKRIFLLKQSYRALVTR
jgi:hypothetical protein